MDGGAGTRDSIALDSDAAVYPETANHNKYTKTLASFKGSTHAISKFIISTLGFFLLF